MTDLVYHQGGNVRTLQFITAFHFGTYANESHTGFDVTDGLAGQATDHVTGSDFFFDRYGKPYEGEITGMSGDFAGQAYFDMSCLDLSVARLEHDLDIHSRHKLIHDFLGGADRETGSNDRDALYGYDGDDLLSGKAGADHLAGGAGQDTLVGGGGADRFLFIEAGDSTDAAPDSIADLSNKDVIDLSRVDPDLQLVSAFDGHAHELVLTYDAVHDRTSLQADLDGDGHADMTVWISGDHTDFTNFAL